MNVDKNKELSRKFGVMSIPTVIFFKDGVEQDRLVGGYPKAEYVKRITDLNK